MESWQGGSIETMATHLTFSTYSPGETPHSIFKTPSSKTSLPKNKKG
jgi:hypothetical protein